MKIFLDFDFYVLNKNIGNIIDWEFFSRLIKIDKNIIVIFVGQNKYKLNHNEKVIYNLDYCYKKLLLKGKLFLGNKQFGDDLIFYLEKIGFIIPIVNFNNVIEELKILHSYLSWPIFNYVCNSLKEDVNLLKEKSLKYNLVDGVYYNDSKIFFEKIITRRTNRNFEKNNIDKNLLNILKVGFSLNNLDHNGLLIHGKTQSAGGFYDIYPYFFILKETNFYKKGIYYFDKYKQKVFYKKDFLNIDFFIEKSIDNFHNLNGFIVLVGNIEFVSKKYSYRSYLYQSIEVGGIFQNVTLYGLYNNFNISAFGGYIEEDLSKEIGLSNDQIIYSVLLF